MLKMFMYCITEISTEVSVLTSYPGPVASKLSCQYEPQEYSCMNRYMHRSTS